MKPLYTVAEGNGEFPMGQLGYDPGKDDLIVAAVHSELNMYTSDEGVALRIWGWDPKALRNEDRYHIEQLIRMFLYQEERILRALERLDAQLGALRSSSDEARERVQEYTDALVEAARKRPQRGMRRDSRDEWDSFDSAIDFYDPEVARRLESHSLGKAGRSFTGEMWRFGDKGYGPDRIPDDELRELIDTVLAVEAEYQLQSLLLDREFTRIITMRGQEFEYLKALAAERAAAEEGDGGWGILGDVLGVVSAVSGVLALIPVLTPICGPIAVVTAVGALGAHTVGAVVEGDWDAGTIVGLVTDVVGAVPAFGAVAKGLRTGTVSMRSVGKVGVAVRSGGRAFLAATGGAAAAEAGAIARYLGAKGAQFVGATKQGGVVAGKVIQGSVSMATQIPTVVALSTGVESGTADSVATGTDLTVGTLEMVGDWKVFGNISKRAGTVSIAAFSKVFA
ncbi:hypothetical protein BX264_4148 [Streptomyces sp. 2333.5]|uniref:hypothetical protein n=1 Tax=unclassified Streptomyces TaxID=2593676 RepID=UPI00089C5630|nr:MULTISPECIES: hypothetical protein [unclassified Streptomyces]PJJ03754.1 hypothetical protein BX264_4148 [Streptomyces sp. 2333.5]SEE30093.1 hypothetical protein SAMN05428943_4321 [Streptomyces sp. 2314.4]SEE57181.1 hypothetical protein SAMN05428942_4249 [Streptomyces sp. 2112.2]